MKFRISLLAILSVLFIAGCDTNIDTPNGVVPSEWLAVVSPTTGSYAGTFEKAPVNFSLTLKDGKLILTPSADLIDPRCDSVVGELKKLSIDEKAKALTEMAFEFSPGQCRSVEGRTLNLYFKYSDDGRLEKVNAQILEYTDIDEICTGNGRNDFERCHAHTTRWYYEGSFQKQ